MDGDWWHWEGVALGLMCGDAGEAGRLLQSFTDGERQRIMRYRSPQHRVQQIWKTEILRRTGIADRLAYESNGKPFLTGGGFVSVTHYGHCAAVATAPFPVGIDGELPDERLARLKSKFVHPAEEKFLDLVDLLHLWTAKESIFKLAGGGLSWTEDIRIMEISKPEAKGQLADGRIFRLRWWERRDGLLSIVRFV